MCDSRLPWNYDSWRTAYPPEYDEEPAEEPEEEEEEEEDDDWKAVYSAELKYALRVFSWQSIDNVSFVSEKEVEFDDGDICYIPVGLMR